MPTSHSTQNDTNTSRAELRVRQIQADHRYLQVCGVCFSYSGLISTQEKIQSSHRVPCSTPIQVDLVLLHMVLPVVALQKFPLYPLAGWGALLIWAHLIATCAM